MSDRGVHVQWQQHLRLVFTLITASNSPDILLAYDDRTGKLIDVREVDDCVDDEDELPMRASMFHRCALYLHHDSALRRLNK